MNCLFHFSVVNRYINNQFTQTLDGVQRYFNGVLGSKKQNSGTVFAAQMAFVASPAHVVQIIPTDAQRRVHVGDFALQSQLLTVY